MANSRVSLLLDSPGERGTSLRRIPRRGSYVIVSRRRSYSHVHDSEKLRAFFRLDIEFNAVRDIRGMSFSGKRIDRERSTVPRRRPTVENRSLQEIFSREEATVSRGRTDIREADTKIADRRLQQIHGKGRR